MMKQMAMVLAVSLTACASEGDGPGNSGGGGKEDGTEGATCLASSRTKQLVPQLAIPGDVKIGKSTRDLIAAELAGATLTSDTPISHPDVASGSTKLYKRGDAVLEDEAIRWKDGTGSEYLRVRVGGELVLVIADHDGDGRVDGFDDEVAGRVEQDYDRDGKLEFLAQEVAMLPDFVIEGYGEGWVPPEHPAMRILEDTDHDGGFDQESVTGKVSEDSWWVHHGNGCD